MATKTDLSKDVILTITNVAKDEANHDAATGVRKLMTLKEAKALKFRDFEYLLDKGGNFTYLENGVVTEIEDTATSITTDKVAVVVRESIQITDRYVQFYQTHQKILLAKGDAIEIKVTKPAEYAHYMSLNGDGITVAVKSE